MVGWALAMLFQIHTIKLAAVDHCGRDTVSSLNDEDFFFELQEKKKTSMIQHIAALLIWQLT